MAICTAAFFGGARLLQAEGLVPADFMYGLFHPARGLLSAVAALLLSFFMHASLFHLCSNLWYLWLFGPAMEDRLGPAAFGLFYGVFGVAAMLVQVASAPLSTVPVIGASGAIAGIMGLHLALLPRGRLVCYVPPIFFFRIPSFIFLLIWICIQYINLRLATPDSPPVAWWAHLGGFACGLGAGIVLLLRSKTLRRGAAQAP
jgi:membrane associated rhomboid family serine protease